MKLKNLVLFLTRVTDVCDNRRDQSRVYLFNFSNDNIHNVVSTLPNIVKIDVENDSAVSTLSNVVRINVEIASVDSTLFNVQNFYIDVHDVVSTLD